MFFAAKDGETLQLAKTRLGADCNLGHELLFAKFRLKLKKVGKTTRPFRFWEFPSSTSGKEPACQ